MPMVDPERTVDDRGLVECLDIAYDRLQQDVPGWIDELILTFERRAFNEDQRMTAIVRSRGQERQVYRAEDGRWLVFYEGAT